jgi:hypothetical protein
LKSKPDFPGNFKLCLLIFGSCQRNNDPRTTDHDLDFGRALLFRGADCAGDIGLRHNGVSSAHVANMAARKQSLKSPDALAVLFR